MQNYLFTVEATLNIKGRGVILAPGIPWGQRVGAGTTIVLQFPDGTIHSSHIRGMEMGPPRAQPTSILIESVAGHETVPVGTVVWREEPEHIEGGDAEHGAGNDASARGEVS